MRAQIHTQARVLLQSQVPEEVLRSPTHKELCTVPHANNIRNARREHGKDDKAAEIACLKEGHVLRNQGRHKGAERFFPEARRPSQKIGGTGGTISINLGETYVPMGRHDEALAKLHEGLRITRSSAEGAKSQGAGQALDVIGRTTTVRSPRCSRTSATFPTRWAC